MLPQFLLFCSPHLYFGPEGGEGERRREKGKGKGEGRRRRGRRRGKKRGNIRRRRGRRREEGKKRGNIRRRRGRRKRKSIYKPVPKVKVELCFFPSSRVPLSHNLCCKRDRHPCTYHLGVLEDQ